MQSAHCLFIIYTPYFRWRRHHKLWQSFTHCDPACCLTAFASFGSVWSGHRFFPNEFWCGRARSNYARVGIPLHRREWITLFLL